MRRTSKNTYARTKIGVSQEDFVPYLWVNRSVLAMYENNKRSLPHGASARYAAIEISLSRPETAIATEETVLEQKQAAIEVLKRRHADCLFFIKRTQRQLDKMQQQYGEYLNMVGVAATAPGILAEIFPNNERYTNDVECLENFAGLAKDKMDKCGIGQQQLLQLKIDALQFEADKIQQLLEG